MLLGALILYLLGVCLVFAVGLFADDTLQGQRSPLGFSLGWRALGAVLWPVALPFIVAMGILARRRLATAEEGDRPQRQPTRRKDKEV